MPSRRIGAALYRCALGAALLATAGGLGLSGGASAGGDGDRPLAALLEEARRAWEVRDFDRALSLCAEVVRRDPANRLALYDAGILFETTGRPEDASRLWWRALEVDPGDLFAWDHFVRCRRETGGLDVEMDPIEEAVIQDPEAELPRLRLALALQAAGRGSASVPHLESVLLGKPASNIAYTFLKDAFGSKQEFVGYVDDVASRAAAAEAPENLRLLHIRLLLERGRPEEARARALAGPWKTAVSSQLLARAGLLEASAAESGRGRMVGTSAEVRPIRENAEGDLPDFGPSDPRSAPRHLRLGRQAQSSGDVDTAVGDVRRALAASPLNLEPRMQLAQLLVQRGRIEEARSALRGPVAPSAWDLYMQAWRAVRDDFIDPDHAGVDIYRLREQARPVVRALEDARQQVTLLLDSLHDPYARLYSPEAFADYLLAPNAVARNRPSPRTSHAIEPRPSEEGPARPTPAETSPRVDPKPLVTTLPVPRPRTGATGGGPGAPGGPATPSPSLAFVVIPSLAGLDVPDRVERLLAGTRGAAGAILDLRGNRGGEGMVAVRVASLFLPSGTEICRFVSRRGTERETVQRDSSARPSGPLAVLVDAETASAAELLAATLREAAGATLVGGRTAGKGVGQRVVLLPDGSGLSLTRLRILPPAGASWHGVGLAPDVASDRPVEAARDVLMKKLAEAPGSLRRPSASS